MKRGVYLYLNIENIELLKAQRLNISKYVDTILEMQSGKKPNITEQEKLRLANIQLTMQLQQANDKIKKFEETKNKKTEKIDLSKRMVFS